MTYLDDERTTNIGDQVRAELMAIKQASPDNMLHVKQVERWARKNRDSQLHAHLEWNDEKAAELYRHDQIRRLIFIYVREDDDTPRLISLMPDRVNGGGYRDIRDVSRNQRLSKLAEDEATRELLRAWRKYGHIKKFLGIWRQIEQLAPADEEKTSRKVA